MFRNLYDKSAGFLVGNQQPANAAIARGMNSNQGVTKVAQGVRASVGRGSEYPKQFSDYAKSNA